MTNKTEKLYVNLRARALGSVQGQPFLSFRAIMTDYSVSQSTVTKATQRLVEEGLLRKNIGKEMEITEEVLKHRSDASPILCLALPHWQSDWYSLIEHHFFDMADKLNYELEILRYDWRLRVPHHLPQTGINAMVLVADTRMLSPEDLRRVDEFEIPYVVFGRNLSGMAVNCVSSDGEYAGAKAAHLLVDLGHRSLAVIISQPLSESISDRIKGFRQYCELNNINAEIIDCKIVNGDFAPQKVYRTLLERFQSGKPSFTGLFTLCEISAKSIYRACAETGIRLPQDLSVVAVGESWQPEYMIPPLTTIGSDLSAMVRESVRILTGPEARGPNFAHRLMKPCLMKRDSTAPFRTGRNIL